ncbi:hypothetical protein BCD67_23775 [Oscillatoriales cyanobacterium USR001]|nr:hypothetical protein BCD67_23775 [Oscillatoriales cyanobacterium USR001]
MLIASLQKFLTSPIEKTSRSRVIFWLSLSLTFAALYSILGLKEAFGSEYVVQDDARQHVFWMMRFIDPALFPNDLIADYFQSVAPAGYKTVYKIAAIAGINPLLFHKILPMILGLISTYYCFSICLEILPVPMTGFIASLILNQSMWITDDLASATPRAFIYPLFLGFLYYLLRFSLLPSLLKIALIGLFYPQYIFIISGILILRLLHWKDGSLRLSQDRNKYLFCITGLGISFLVLLPFALTTSKFGPIITIAQAKQMPEFLPGGRVPFFFNANFKRFWLTGRSTGMFSKSLFTPVTYCFGLLFPFLLLFSSAFPLAKQIKSSIWLLLQIVIVALTMFFIAHAVLFNLHIPNRYTAYTFRIVIVLLTAISLTLIIDSLCNWALRREAKVLIQSPSSLSPIIQGNSPIKNSIALGIIGIIAVLVLLYPCFVKDFPRVGYKTGRMPELYKFFQQQPKDILIASLSEEVSFLPSFSQRSILVGREYGIPYHIGYYRQFKQRAIELIRAQYSPDITVVKNLINKYGIDFWMLEKNALTLNYVEKYGWLKNFDSTSTVIAELKQGKTPALKEYMERCTVFQNDSLLVLKASCIAKYDSKD